MELYFDNAATTRVSQMALEAMQKAMLENYGNPSSLHAKGLEAEKVLKKSRALLVSVLAIKNGSLVFTSGGTESNNLALIGTLEANSKIRRLIISAIEHPSILETASYLASGGIDVSIIPVTQTGLIRTDALEESLKKGPALVSIMAVNNETGIIQNIPAISRMVRSASGLFHTDAVQAWSLWPALTPQIDLMSLSSHKIHGPKGCGALYIRSGTRLSPLIHGSHQENGIRAGTENIPGIAGFAAAVQTLPGRVAVENIRVLKTKLYRGIIEHLPETQLNGPAVEDAAPHILNLSFPGIRAEILVHSLESRGLFVSTGAACHSRKKGGSHVLEAMKLPRECIESALRWSLSSDTTEDDVNLAIKILTEEVNKLKKIFGRK